VGSPWIFVRDKCWKYVDLKSMSMVDMPALTIGYTNKLCR
jgi:hypothetical protein